jgi:hypothetical protein
MNCLRGRLHEPGLHGYQLRVDSRDTVADGGVDATVDSPTASTWCASGKSCWQFKRSDLAPAACANELANASWAQELVRDGATYTLVLGRRLNDRAIDDRRSSLIEKAHELGLIQVGDDDRVQVLDANVLARWSTEFPSLAVSTMLHGPGTGMMDHATWSASNRHTSHWVSDQEREEGIKSIHEIVKTEIFSEVRIIGESGVGKTRLVMEALRVAELAPLVVYVPDQQVLSAESLAHVLSADRTAILVVDECPGRSHEKLAERIPTPATLRLVTIGEADAYSLRAPVLEVTTMEQAKIEEFLELNYPILSSEARRFVGEQGAGNVRFTIVLADRVQKGGAEAAELISRSDAEQLVQALLPEGRPFYLATVLALFERIGWDKELAPQLGPLRAFTGATEDDLRAVGRDLESRGLFARQGRYRAIAPHPVAVVLAASAWSSEGHRIRDELLPALDREMSLSLFARVAALGRYEPARQVLRQLMRPNDLFGSLASIEDHNLGRFLTQLAIVAPAETMEHLGAIIGSASLDELRAAEKSRRDLVWTLEKLVWHQATFEPAADSLLRLALAESETWANNATGTWVALFGTMLPGTAATPTERVSYLSRIAASGDPATRLLAIRASGRALTASHESITVSGELQAGALVEPRGSPSTFQEAADYRRAVIEILTGLATDATAEVSAAASNALIESVHTLIDDPLVGDYLIQALVQLPGDSLLRLRRDIEHLVSLHERADQKPDLVDRLRQLSNALPQATEREQLQVLLNLQAWDLKRDELRSRLYDAVRSLNPGDTEWLLDVLKSEKLPAAWELGAALSASGTKSEELEKAFVDAFRTNPAALVGYLRALVDAGEESAFDQFLESSGGSELETVDILAIAARGPATDQARRRVLSIAPTTPVSHATTALLGWLDELSDDEAATLLSAWSVSIESQQDYNVLVDWLNFRRSGETRLPDLLRPAALNLLMMRKQFPDLGQQRWDWSQLASQLVGERPIEVVDCCSS